MKRKNNLYKDIYKFENILYCFNEVCKNTKNKRKVEEFKSYKSIYISRCYNELKNKKYEMGKFHIFYIKDPKERRIVSLNMYDKLINHLVSKYILYSSIIPCLIDSNCASRPNKGVKYALDLYYKYRRILDKKKKDYYILKCDIKSYFSSINIDILKRKIKHNNYLYNIGKINFNNYISSYICYKNISY